MITYQTLLPSIGSIITFRGSPHEIVEVLNDPLALVLSSEQSKNIQTNQFGEARRRVHNTITVNIYLADGNTLTPELELFFSQN